MAEVKRNGGLVARGDEMESRGRVGNLDLVLVLLFLASTRVEVEEIGGDISIRSDEITYTRTHGSASHQHAEANSQLSDGKGQD